MNSPNDLSPERSDDRDSARRPQLEKYFVRLSSVVRPRSPASLPPTNNISTDSPTTRKEHSSRRLKRLQDLYGSGPSTLSIAGSSTSNIATEPSRDAIVTDSSVEHITGSSPISFSTHDSNAGSSTQQTPTSLRLEAISQRRLIQVDKSPIEASLHTGIPLTQYQPAQAPDMPAMSPLECDSDYNNDDENDDAADAQMVDAVLSTFSKHAQRFENVRHQPPAVSGLNRVPLRSCHKCGLGFSAAARHICIRCHHVRCTRCPRSISARDSFTTEQITNTETLDQLHESAIPAMRRVYRRPRQRVRYTCEHCRTIFSTTNRCIECGHQRCRSCVRDPRPPPQFDDPFILSAVAQQLEGYESPGYSPD